MRVHSTLFRWAFGLLATLLAQVVFAQAPAPLARLRVCQNDVAHVPWRLPEPGSAKAQRTGLDFVFLNLLAKRTGLQMDIVLAPGRRCLAELRAGRQDAILGISHLPAREADGVYPHTPDGRVDERNAVRFDTYAWYVPAHAEIAWDGRRLALPRTSLVGVQSSSAIIQKLAQMGYPVEDGARSTEAVLEKLVRGRVEAAALLSSHADLVLQRVPGWRHQVRRLDPPLERRAYYMIFSHAYAQQRGVGAMVALWADVAAVRDSAPYRQAEAQALLDMQSLLEREAPGLPP